MASTIGTFGSFTISRLGIYAAQAGLNITGNNIANINTLGYTRQALDQVSFKSGGSDRYASKYDLRTGNGVLTTGVSQLRDPYLDIRYRTEMSTVGALDAKLSGLESIAAILDEVGDGENNGDGIIEAQLSDLRTTLENLSLNAGQEGYDRQVRESASTLCVLLNSYAKDLEEVEQNAITKLEEDVDVINEILTNIRDLNSAIRKSEIHGDSALEMRDERNLLIDELSQYMKIDVLYSMEDIGAGHMVEKLTIKLGNANPDEKATNSHDTATLVDGVYATQLSVGDETNNYTVSLDQLKDSKNRVLTYPDGTTSQQVTLADNDLYGALQATRELLTEAGEFSTQAAINGDPDATTKRGIPYYQKALDMLANKIATVFNENNPQAFDGYETYIDGDGVERYAIKDNVNCTLEDPLQPYYPHGTVVDVDSLNISDALKQQIKADQAVHLPKGGNAHGVEKWIGGTLFSNSGDGNDTTGITAANISVSLGWSTGEFNIARSYETDANGDIPSTKNDNILHMISLMDTKMEYYPKDVDGNAASTDPMFKGTFQEMFTDISSVLGNDIRSTTVMMNNHYNASVELDTSRDSVSGVDLNDEAMNLMQYQKSYSAACRLLTTLDESLDKLINGTGIVGR